MPRTEQNRVHEQKASLLLKLTMMQECTIWFLPLELVTVQAATLIDVLWDFLMLRLTTSVPVYHSAIVPSLSAEIGSHESSERPFTKLLRCTLMYDGAFQSMALSHFLTSDGRQPLPLCRLTFYLSILLDNFYTLKFCSGGIQETNKFPLLQVELC